MQTQALRQQLAKTLATIIAFALFSAIFGRGAAEAVPPLSNSPIVNLSPVSLSFSGGFQLLGQFVIMSNTGNATLTITRLAVTGTNASDFGQTNTCGSSLAAGAKCTISVTFKPSAGGVRTAALSITDNAPHSPQTVSLSGTSTAPTVSLSPTKRSFASQSVGTTSAAQTITLTNAGNATMNITSLAVTGTNASNFAQTNNCGVGVAAGANCTISVTFTPSASGSRAASLTLTDNATGSPQSVNLTGTGTAAASLSPTRLSFENQAVDMISPPQVVTLRNTGSATLSIASISFTGADAADFAESDTCGSPVAAGGNCTIAILFTPSAAGTRTGSLSIGDNASGSSQSASLSGTGTHNVTLSWTSIGSSGLGGYNVYRGTTSGGESSTPVNSSPVIGTTFIDENVQAGRTYYYVVTALSNNENVQSGGSNQASATVPSP